MPVVLTNDAVREALRDPRLSSRSFTDDMRAAGLSATTAEQFTPLFRRHGEDHRRHRALLAAAFTPRSVERLRPVVAEVAGHLADGIEAAGRRCEFVAAFAKPLPPRIFAVIFGLPPSDSEQLGQWAEVVALAFSPSMSHDAVERVEATAAELRDYCAELIVSRRSEPRDDLASRLLEVEVDGSRLDDADIVATISGFVFAGAETTRRQLTELIRAFAASPDAWERVAADPTLAANAVEEVLRHRPIVPGLSRLALEPFEHDGLELAPGDRLMVSFLAANRDESILDDPDSFDVTRADADVHLTFGWGPHYCLGAGLARVELQESLRVLVDRFGAPSIADDGVGAAGGFGVPDTIVMEFAG